MSIQRTAENKLRIEIHPKLEFLYHPAPYKVLYGGRSGMKSWGVAQALLILGAQKKLHILCAREIQRSISESVHKLLCDQIKLLQLDAFYQIQETSIYGLNGTDFFFVGLQDRSRKIKSAEGIDIVWIEEATKINRQSWIDLIPTIRKEDSEIWVTFNPDEETDYTYQHFVLNPPGDAVVRKVGWEDNPFMSERNRRQKDEMYASNPDAADNIWGGNPRRRSAAHIFASKYRVFDLGPRQPDWEGPYQGLDFGFAEDPNAFVRTWVINNKKVGDDTFKKILYIEHAKYGYHTELDHLPILLKTVPDSHKYEIRADNSRPETVRHLQTHGFPRVISCDKGKGSVEEGIHYLLNYDAIVIHPSQKEMIEEAKFYSYKVDKDSGIPLPDIIDAFNHGWDAVRYAHEPRMRHRGTMKISDDFLARI